MLALFIDYIAWGVSSRLLDFFYIDTLNIFLILSKNCFLIIFRSLPVSASALTSIPFISI